MKPFTRIALFFLMAVAGCGTPGEGFRFDAEYVAEHSRFVLRMAAAGIRPRGGGVGAAFGIAQICPAASAEGRPIRMTFTAAPDGSALLECGEIGAVPIEWNAGSREGLLRGVLTSAGFRQIDPAELQACLTAISRALGSTGPEGGTVGRAPLRATREEMTPDNDLDADQPPARWVEQSEVAGCN